MADECQNGRPMAARFSMDLVRSRRLELPRVAPQRPQRCASTSSATTACLCSDAAGHTKSDSPDQAPPGPWSKIGSASLKQTRESCSKCQALGATYMEWRIDDRPVSYEDAVAQMEQRATAIRAGQASELVWL